MITFGFAYAIWTRNYIRRSVLGDTIDIGGTSEWVINTTLYKYWHTVNNRLCWPPNFRLFKACELFAYALLLMVIFFCFQK